MSGLVETLRSSTSTLRRRFSRKSSSSLREDQDDATNINEASHEGIITDEDYFGKICLEDLETALDQLPDVLSSSPAMAHISYLERDESIKSNGNHVINDYTPSPRSILASGGSVKSMGDRANSAPDKRVSYNIPLDLLEPSPRKEAMPKVARPLIPPSGARPPMPLLQRKKSANNSSYNPNNNNPNNSNSVSPLVFYTSNGSALQAQPLEDEVMSPMFPDRPNWYTSASMPATTNTSPGKPQYGEQDASLPDMGLPLQSAGRRASMPDDVVAALNKLPKSSDGVMTQPRSVSESLMSFDPNGLPLPSLMLSASGFEHSNSAIMADAPTVERGNSVQWMLDGMEFEELPPTKNANLNITEAFRSTSSNYSSVSSQQLQHHKLALEHELNPIHPCYSEGNLLATTEPLSEELAAEFDSTLFGSRDVVDEETFPSPPRLTATFAASQAYNSMRSASATAKSPASRRLNLLSNGPLPLFNRGHTDVHNSLATTPRRSSNVSAAVSCPSTPTSALKKSKRKPKMYLNKEPSLYCHICARDSRKVPSVVCGNYTSGMCRKVVCKLCFEKFEWDFESASARTGAWQCSHCCEQCPDVARCHIYDRINAKRVK
mmetsp:Transcript_12766/g.21863  ORF Transcript_12766/g.21863 Transcript_12766/m.21863 type:complete len:606 (+) Transcript_12766:602-2419(+)